MKIIKPTVNTLGMIVSTDAIELYSAWVETTYYTVGTRVTYLTGVYECTVASPALWSSSVTYAKDALVRYGTNIYQSLQATNLNKIPSSQPTWWVLISTLTDYNPVNYPLLWTKISSTNKWAMFDGEINSRTTKADSLTVTFTTGIISSLAIINTNANTIKITVRDGLGGDIIYEDMQGLAGVVLDWYEYFFNLLDNVKTSIIFQNIPPFGSSHVTLEFVGGSDLAVGEVIFGSTFEFGYTQEGLSSGIIDYSKKETDDFGNATLLKRAYSKTMQANIFVENYKLNQVQRLMYNLRATPTVWIATEDPYLEEAGIVYGFYKDFSSTISYPTMTMMSLEVEGLI